MSLRPSRTWQVPSELLGDVQSHVVRSMDPDAAIYFFFHYPRSLPGLASDSARRLVRALLADDSALHPGLQESLEPLFKHVEQPLKELRIWSEEHQHDRESRGTSKRLRKPVSANIAFTWTGLQALGLDRDTLASFPEDFSAGMAARAKSLFDTEDAAPENWDSWLGNRDVHGVFWMNFRWQSNVQPNFSKFLEHARKIAAASSWETMGLEIVHVEVGWKNCRTDPSGYRYRVEHFGFNDGLSQPFADLRLTPPPAGGGTPKPDGTWDPIAPGEVLLGLPDEDGLIQKSPCNKALRSNGTYLVFRKLEQDVIGFRRFVASQDNGAGPTNSKLASQMLGRWGNGTPIVVSPDGPRSYSSSLADRQINDFRYQGDPQGRLCPIGAHIRRMNPRDTNNRDLVRRHRILRRGIAYGGPQMPEDSSGDGLPRGLLFIALNARINQQFEFLQRAWLNTGEFLGQVGAGRCPIVGNNDSRIGDQFVSPDRPAPITNLPRFVKMRGGEYFFVPSIAALTEIANGNTFPPDADDESEAKVGNRGNDYYDASNPNPSLATTPDFFDPDKLFERGLKERFLSTTLPFVPLEGGAQINVPIAFFAGYDDVKQVLCDEQHFSVKLYADAIGRITCGQNMIVGMRHDDPERQRRIQIWNGAVRPQEDSLIIGQIVEAAVAKVLARCRPAGKLDLVADIARIVPLAMAQAYYGIPGPDWYSPTLTAAAFNKLEPTQVFPEWLQALPKLAPRDIPFASLEGWTRCAFLQVFVNVVRARELIDLAERTTQELLQYLSDLILQEYKEPDPETILGRMVLNGPQANYYGLGSVDDYTNRIKLILAERLVGGTDTVAKAITNVVNYLLENRQILSDAKRAGQEASSDQLDAIIRECLRFDPVAPMIFRYCEQDCEVDGNKLQAGTIVCALLKAAMFDGSDNAFPNPFEFRTDRPANRYLHFGDSAHHCAGSDTAEQVLYLTIKSLLQLNALRRAAGPAGLKQEMLQLPESLVVHFEAC